MPNNWNSVFTLQFGPKTELIERDIFDPNQPDHVFRFRVRKLSLMEDFGYGDMADALEAEWAPLRKPDGSLAYAKGGKEPIRAGKPIFTAAMEGQPPKYVVRMHCQIVAAILFAWEGDDRPDPLHLFILMMNDAIFAQILDLSAEIRSGTSGGEQQEDPLSGLASPTGEVIPSSSSETS